MQCRALNLPSITGDCQENKDYEGDPQIKARVRGLQYEMHRQRMIAAVPTADVVVTNPTQLAIALKYDPEIMSAPKVSYNFVSCMLYEVITFENSVWGLLMLPTRAMRSRTMAMDSSGPFLESS